MKVSYLGCISFLCLDVAGCDITLTVTDSTQFVATEGYPNDYKNSQDCDFNFVAPSGRRIVVVFEDFNLEEGYDFIHFRKINVMTAQTVILTITLKSETRANINSIANVNCCYKVTFDCFNPQMFKFIFQQLVIDTL